MNGNCKNVSPIPRHARLWTASQLGSGDCVVYRKMSSLYVLHQSDCTAADERAGESLISDNVAFLPDVGNCRAELMPTT